MCAADVERTQIWSSSFWQLLVRPRCILHCRSLNYPLLSLLFSNIVCLGTSPSSAFFLFAPYDLFVEIGTLDFLKTLGFLQFGLYDNFLRRLPNCLFQISIIIPTI